MNRSNQHIKMDTSSTPKSSKKSVTNETPAKKVIKLPYNANNLFVPADQLRKMPKREDDQYAAGDLVWVKTKGFPWWPCIITVDPETGKYSKIVAIRDKNDKAFHVQYFGSRAFRGYTQGNIMEYEGKKKYELKLDQIKNTPTPNKSQRKMELNNYEIKHTFKKDWNLASAQADEAMMLDRAARIETLTFEYILDRPKSTIKKVNVEEPQPSVSSAPKSTTGKKRKAESQQPSVSKSALKSIQSTKRKKKTAGDAKSNPTDVYDFNEFSDEFQVDVTPSKPFELSSAKRAKGEYAVYAKKLRAEIEKENPDLDEEDVEAKLKRNWELMSEDMRNNYAPRPSLFQNLSFTLDTSQLDTSLNDEDIPIPDLNNSMKTKTGSKSNRKSISKSNKRQKTAEKPAPEPKTPRGRRGRSRAEEEEKIAETNGLDEKENAIESEELETEATVEENVKDEEIVSMTRSSSRKKSFNQGNETNETTNENTTNNTPKRQSARMRTARASVEPEKTKSPAPSAKSPAPSAKSSSLKSASSAKAPTPSTRSSRRLSAGNGNSSLAPSVESPVNPIKSNSIFKKEPVVANNQLVAVEETNGISEDSVSCSSESEKTEQQKDASEESKEMTCAKCLESDKGLIKCDGECLSHYHKECLHRAS